MKKLVLSVALAVAMSGCAVLETTNEILDIIYDDPEPVCDAEAVGLEWKGEVCLKFSDGSYGWRAK